MILDYKGNKGFRLLNIFELLNKGELVKKTELSQKYSVTEKTIQRDIDDLRAYLSDTHLAEGEVFIQYDRTRAGYYLVRMDREWLTNKEILAVCKILLESRAFCKEELEMLIAKLLAQVTPNGRKQIDDIIRNEQFYYVPLKHGKMLLTAIWELSQYITHNEVIRISYARQDNVEREHEVKPAAIMFSEYYFYLIAFMADNRHDFPTIFRIDRIGRFQSAGTKFRVLYKDKFNDGEFRKRVPFMYAGELRTVRFLYRGILEAVLDRLPTATIESEVDGGVIIRAEVYGDGIDMWLRSQGEKVEVL